MRIAFYAPMKAPDHPVPSGDRRMAQAFLLLLRRLDHEVSIACHLRSWDGGGDPLRQQRLRALGGRCAARLARRRPPPELWFTYHLYHKAPDHLGPAVSAELGIPYVVAEASIARRQADGPWASGYRDSIAGMRCAAAVLAMTAVDHAGLRPIVPAGKLHRFAPFIDTTAYRRAVGDRPALAHRHGLDQEQPWLLAVAMMRADAKLRSYRLLADALMRITDEPWQLVVVGDGPARLQVEACLRPLGRRVRLLGMLPAIELPALYAGVDLYVWPACNEAYGLALLESQAAGCPVVAGDGHGVPDIVTDGETGLLPPTGNAEAFAGAVMALLRDGGRRRRMGAAARVRTVLRHDVDVAAAAVARILSGIERCASA